MKTNEYTAMFEAEHEHWWYKNLHNEALYWIDRTLVKQQNAVHPTLTALDLGCGTGGMLQRMQHKFANIAVFGLDYYSIALKLAKRKTSSHLVQGDIKNIPFLPKSFDFILCLDVLYTKEAYPCMQSALCMIHDLLKDSGIFVLQVPAFSFLTSQHDVNVHGAHRFNKKEIQASLAEAGFSEVKIYYRYNTLFWVAWIVRKLFAKKTHDENESHVTQQNQTLNKTIYSYFAFESWLNRRFAIPFGLSVFAVAHKQPESSSSETMNF